MSDEPVVLENTLLIASRGDDGLTVHLDPSQIGSRTEAGIILADTAHHLVQGFVAESSGNAQGGLVH
ncbi:MAG: hypothetical protein AAF764_08820 [Pseudomonadota bacterium]